MWLRLEVDAVDDPGFFALAAATGCSVGDAFRCAVKVWGKMARFAPGGELAAVPDIMLEEWAGWAAVPRGTSAGLSAGRPVEVPAPFAGTFRSLFQTEDGFLVLWRELQGPLLERQERDRARKRSERAAPASKSAVSAGPSAECPADSPQDRRGNGARNENENENESKKEEEEGPGVAGWPRLNVWVRSARTIAGEESRSAVLREYRRAVEDSGGLWTGIAALLDMALLEGFGRGPFTAAELDMALLDMQVAGWPKSGRALRSFLQGQRPAPPSPQQRAGRPLAVDANGPRGLVAPPSAGRLSASTFRQHTASADPGATIPQPTEAP